MRTEIKTYYTVLDTNNIFRCQMSPRHSSLWEHLTARRQPQGRCAGGIPLHVRKRPRQPGSTLPRDRGRQCHCHRDLLAVSGSALPGAEDLPLLSNPLSWKQEALPDHPEGCGQAGCYHGCEHRLPGLKGHGWVRRPRCPRPSALAHVCMAQCSGHQLRVAAEPLHCGRCDRGTGFCIFFLFSWFGFKEPHVAPKSLGLCPSSSPLRPELSNLAIAQ